MSQIGVKELADILQKDSEWNATKLSAIAYLQSPKARGVLGFSRRSS